MLVPIAMTSLPLSAENPLAPCLACRLRASAQELPPIWVVRAHTCAATLMTWLASEVANRSNLTNTRSGSSVPRTTFTKEKPLEVDNSCSRSFQAFSLLCQAQSTGFDAQIGMQARIDLSMTPKSILAASSTPRQYSK